MASEPKNILVVDDDPQMQSAMKAVIARMGYCVETANNGEEAFKKLSQQQFDMVVSDQKMPVMDGIELLKRCKANQPDIPFIIVTAYGTVDQAVAAMRLGAEDFINKPFSNEDLARVVRKALDPETSSLRKKARGSMASDKRCIVTNDPVMIKVLETAEAVARSDATVLIQGESGTGKEGISRYIHSVSHRSKGPFIAVNCAALPESLLESELFGHEKGAFTGAQSSKPGKFELAHGGTILLDEISEMDLGLQAKLLRVLQEREIDRVGGQTPIHIDVRVIATTNRNLAAMVAEGKFREDLYYRLNVIPITLPPLRDRKGDIRLLVEHFMRKYLGANAPRLTPEILQRLESYRWPGNVRELENAVHRAAVLSKGRNPQMSDFFITDSPNTADNTQSLQARIERIVSSEGDDDSAQGGEDIGNETLNYSGTDLLIRPGMSVAEMEQLLILETLKATNNNRTRAAKMLGISIRTLRNKLNEYRKNGINV